jgi:hypothetical protein
VVVTTIVEVVHNSSPKNVINVRPSSWPPKNAHQSFKQASFNSKQGNNEFFFLHFTEL